MNFYFKVNHVEYIYIYQITYGRKKFFFNWLKKEKKKLNIIVVAKWLMISKTRFNYYKNTCSKLNVKFFQQ